MEIQFQGQYSKRQLLDALKLHFRPSRGEVIVRCILAIGSVGLTGYFQFTQPYSIENTVSLGVCLVLMLYFCARPAIQPYETIARYRKKKDLLEPLRGTVTENGVTIRAVDANSKLNWGVFNKYKKAGELVLLYQDKQWFSPLPRTFFQSETDWGSFVTLVEEKVPKAE